MKNLLISLLLLLSLCSYGQNRFDTLFEDAHLSFNIALKYGANDLVYIKHANYVTFFSKSLHYPVLVEWWDTKAKVTCKSPEVRVNDFASDPELKTETDLNKYYEGSGFDRGHMSDDKDNLCLGQEVQKECFYYSNMTPQTPGLNRGSWKRLEDITRNIAGVVDSVHVWCGSIGTQKKIGPVSVPFLCWKVIYIVKQKTYRAFLFKNSTDDSLNKNPECDIKMIEGLTNFKFK